MALEHTTDSDGDNIASSTPANINYFDLEKTKELQQKDPDGAGAPELAETKELRYAIGRATCSFPVG
ncbi:hypothetical protein VI817_004040 [Penicillium citrinum]|nr:hypothetical protein VI817_004040 [Penicillium citrinum]